MLRHAVHRAATVIAAATASPPPPSPSDSGDELRDHLGSDDDAAISLALVPPVTPGQTHRQRTENEWTTPSRATNATENSYPSSSLHAGSNEEETGGLIPASEQRIRQHRRCTLLPVHVGAPWVREAVQTVPTPLISREAQSLQEPDTRQHLHLHHIEPPLWTVVAHYVTCGMFPIHQARIALSDTDSNPATPDAELWHNPFSDLGEDQDSTLLEEPAASESLPEYAAPGTNPAPDLAAPVSEVPASSARPSPGDNSIILMEAQTDLNPPLLGREPSGGVAALIADGIDDARVVNDHDLAKLETSDLGSDHRAPLLSPDKANDAPSMSRLATPPSAVTSGSRSASLSPQARSTAFQSAIIEGNLTMSSVGDEPADHILVQVEEGCHKPQSHFQYSPHHTLTPSTSQSRDVALEPYAGGKPRAGAQAKAASQLTDHFRPVTCSSGENKHAPASVSGEGSDASKSPVSQSSKLIELKEITAVSDEMHAQPRAPTPLEADAEVGLPPIQWNKGKFSRRWSTIDCPPLHGGGLQNGMDQKHPTVLLRHHAFHPCSEEAHLYNQWPDTEGPQRPGPHVGAQAHSPVLDWGLGEGHHPLYRRSSSSSSAGTNAAMLTRPAGFHHQQPLSKLSRQEAEKLLGLGFTPSHPSTAWKRALALPPPTPPTPGLHGGRARSKSTSSASDTPRIEATGGELSHSPHDHSQTGSVSTSSRRSSRARATSGLMMASANPPAYVSGGDSGKRITAHNSTPFTTE